MINLRYHIVSIAAVFLAMAIGIAVGSTLVERATVDALQARLDEQESRLDENDRRASLLEAQVAAAEAAEARLLEEAAPRLLDGEIDEVPVLVLTQTGTSETTIEAAMDALVAGGARLGGVLTLTDRASVEEPGDVALLVDVLALAPTTDPAEVRAALVREVAQVLTRAAAAPPAPEPLPPPTSTTTTIVIPTESDGVEPAAPEDLRKSEEDLAEERANARAAVLEEEGANAEQLIATLVESGFATFDGTVLGGLEVGVHPETGARSVVVVDAGSSPATTPLLLALLEALSDEAPAPAVVAGWGEDGAEGESAGEEASGEQAGTRQSLVERIRAADGELPNRVSTVDHLERFAGRVALVLALADLPEQVGHYGTEASARALLPRPL